MTQLFIQQRHNMVESQIKPFYVINENVLNAFRQVAREPYIPAERRGMAYLGEHLPMGEGRFLVEPAIHARLIQECSIGSTQPFKVLDVGCLNGYTSAILQCLTPHVVGLDRMEWTDKAKETAPKGIEFLSGSLTDKVWLHSAFDLIVINGAVSDIPDTMIQQLKEGGRIGTYWRDAHAQKGYAVLYHKQNNILREQILFDAFVPFLPGYKKEEGFSF